MEEKKNEGRVIPTVGHVRIGNFKLWKSINGADGVQTMIISDLSGSWSVQIPSTYLAYPMIEKCYMEGEEEFLHTYIANIDLVSAIANGFYQRGVAMVGHCYLKPELLREGYKPETGPGHEDLMDEARKICDGFLKWYEGVLKDEEARKAAETAKGADENDDMAEKAAEILAEPDADAPGVVSDAGSTAER